MKNFILTLFTFLLSFIGYSQMLNESFEAATFPPTGWAVFDNGVFGGTNINWGTNATANSGVKAAFMNRQQAMPNGSTSRDFLATPSINIPENSQIKFFTRVLLSGVQAGTFYKVMIKPALSGAQNDPTGYVLLEDWNDATDPIVANFNTYEEKTLNVPAIYNNTQVYVAFMMEHTSNGSVGGNRWLVDDVKVVVQCLAPDISSLTASPILATTATLGWAATAGTTSYEIENMLSTQSQGEGTLGTSTTNSFLQENLTGTTAYKFYVRANCGGGNFSAWVGPYSYTTTVAPPVCGGNFVDNGGNAGDYAASSDDTITICPTIIGQVVTVTFTLFDTEANFDGLYVFEGSTTNINAQIPSSNDDGNVPGGVPGSFWGTAIPGPFTSSAVDGCLTFRFRSDGGGQNGGWLANVTCGPPPTCRKPTALTSSAIAVTTASIGWTNVGTNVASNQIIAVACGSPIPAANNPNWVNATSNPFLVTGLTSGTCYDFYVRSLCAAPDESAPSTPTSATTLIAPPECGGNFVDNGGVGGSTTSGSVNNYTNNANVTTTICPNVPGDMVTVTFTLFETEDNWDGLYVYHGSSAVLANQIASNNPPANVPGGLAGSYWGDVVPGPFTSDSADGCLTFVFRSDASINSIGWLSNITCTPQPPCRKPSSLTTSSTLATNVTLGWTQQTNPNGSLANAWRVIRVPCGATAPAANNPNWIDTNSNPYTFTGLTANTCYDFYVQAVCSPTESSPIVGPKSTFTPLTCLMNFSDTGGLGGDYGNNEDVVTTICPTLPNQIVIVEFTAFNTDAEDDGLYVFDGNGVNDPIIDSTNPQGNVPGGIPGSYWGTTVPSPFISTSPDGCLTFRFRSNGFTAQDGWAANVTCAPRPTCSRPYQLTATNITQTSATLSWLQPANPNGTTATAWEILVLPAGSPIPAPGTGGIPTGNPFQINGLTPGIAYVYYVRAICSGTDSSLWSAFNFATIPTNDECTNATFAIVNQNLNCVQTTPGTLVGATLSTQASTCAVTNNDVWFTFTATTVTHIISFNNVVANNLQYAIYQGNNCGALTQISCNSGAGLVAGTTYLIRVYSENAGPQNLTFDLCIGTLPCTEAPAFCTGQTVTYANSTNVPSLGQIGCLFTSPNPAFFFLQVNQAGPLNYLISQVDNGGVPRDVDYVAWGPFTDLATACTGVPANPLPGILPALTPAGGCQGDIHACSYSTAPQEIMCIPDAQLCEVYVVMITNFSNQAGSVTFTQTNDTGGGTTSCFPINTFNYSKNSYCQNEPNPTPVLANGASAGTYTSTPGLVIDPATGTIDLLASMPGAYIVTSTTLTSTAGACTNIPTIVTTRTVIITAPATGTIVYTPAVYCDDITTQQPVTRTGTPNGSFSVTPAGLSINPGNGDVLPVASTPGVYTVTYTVAANGGCPAYTTTTPIEIIATPNVIQPNNVVSCNCYVLPTLTVGNYYPQAGGLGTQIPAGTSICTNQTIYIYASNGTCVDEKMFTISVGTNITPVTDFTYTTPVCKNSIDPVAPIPAPGFTSGGTFSSTTGLIIAPTTGIIDLSASLVGTYNVTYTITADASICLDGRSSNTSITITDTITPNTTFTYTTPVCRIGNANPSLSALFTTGGTFTSDLGLSISPSTGVINLTASTLGLHTITYTTTADATTCTTAANGTATIIIVDQITPETGFSYTTPVCRNSTTPSTLVNPIPATGFTLGGTYTSNSTALLLDPLTGAIDLSSPAGTYTVTYSVAANAATCLIANSSQATITINDIVTPVTGFSYSTPVCRSLANLTPTTVAGFTTGGTFSAIPAGLVINPSTGAVSSSSLSGSYTVMYEVTADTNGAVCRAYAFSTTQLVIEPEIIATSTLNYSTSNNFCGFGVGIVQPILTTSYTYDGVPSSTVPTPNPTSTGIYTVTPAGLPGLDLNAVTGEINFANSIPGIYIVKYTSTGIAPNCYSGNAPEVTVTIITPTSEVVGFSYTSSVCKSDTTNPTPNKVSGFVDGGTYSSTPGLDINPATGEINLLNSTPGNYTVNYQLASNFAICSLGGFSSATITINPVIVPVFAPISVCQDTTAPSLPSSYVNGTTTITGNWIPATIDVSAIGTSTYIFNVNTGQCSDNGSISVTITAPSITPTFAPISVCQNTTPTSLPASYLSGTTTVFGIWTPNTINTASIGTTTYTFTPNTGQCATTGSLSVDVFVPNILPTFTQIAPICQGTIVSVTLPTSSNNLTGQITGTWNSAISSATVGNTTYNFIPNPGQCALPTTMIIEVKPNPVFTITGACQGAAYTLEVNHTPPTTTASYAWFKGTVPMNVTTSTLVVSELATYSCKVTVDGCTEEKTITPIDIICQIQKGISPNGDGLNDSFDLSSFDVNSLEIYNRYGTKVYQQANYKKEWFGQTDGGEALPDGTYYYVINLKVGEAKTGWIYINKQNNN